MCDGREKRLVSGQGEWTIYHAASFKKFGYCFFILVVLLQVDSSSGFCVSVDIKHSPGGLLRKVSII